MTETTDVTVTGVLKIEIPDPPVTLTLTFEPTSDGDTWDPPRLVAALRERGVREGFSESAPAEFLQAAAKAKSGPHTIELISGHPPQHSTPDRVEWKELPEEPPELAEAREQVLRDEGAPEIFRDVREKIQRQKTVTKKGALPFGQPKQEVVTVTETVTRKERVYIDPKVHESRYVESGVDLGTFVPRVTGVPGKDIFGRTIPIKQLADPGFYEGPGIQRTGETIFAGTTGFLRIGKNWADIVPFEPHRWEVELSRDKATCYVVLTPGHPKAQLPSASEIRTAAVDLPYPDESLIAEPELDALIRGQIETAEAGRLPITLSRDASFDIVVAEDKLSAYLNVHKGKGRGKALNLKEIGTAIKQSGLTGLDFKQISSDITAFYEGPEFDMTSYLLAEGVPPTPGPERHVEFAGDFKKGRAVDSAREALRNAESCESLEAFPPEAITQVADVDPEQLVCTIDPSTPGEPGRDVYGAPIPAEAGATPEIVLHENLVRKETIIATTSGGVLDYGEIDGVIHLRVRPHNDAVISVTVSDDRMEALLSLEEGSGTGSRLTREGVDQALERAKVTYGILEDRIAKALEAAKAGTTVSGIVVAEGSAPVNQSENRLEFSIDLKGETAVRIRKDGSADFRSRNAIPTVQEGEEICRVLPSQQEAIDGTDVLGQKIPATSDTGFAVELGENVTREEQADGSVVIRASTSGEVVYEKNRIAVQTSHTIQGDVDMKIGNIKFPGTITIGGTVRSGFYVVSGGDIRIAGGVEGALLSADGDILIKQGVKGAGKAVLRSKRNIMSTFVELATVLSVGDVTLTSSIVRSRIKCNGKITFQGEKGRIIGGQIRARNGLHVLSVGSPRGIKTHVSFGQDYLIADLIEKEEKEIEKVKRRITQVDISMRKLEKEGSRNEALQKLRKEKVQLLKLMEKRGLRLFTLRERFEQHYPSRIVVTGEVHTGTVFESHGRTYEITTPRKGIAVEFNSETGNIDVNELERENKE
ncbi:MAG: flagellar assembly protein A [Alkalispirochaeta sp.]